MQYTALRRALSFFTMPGKGKTQGKFNVKLVLLVSFVLLLVLFVVRSSVSSSPPPSPPSTTDALTTTTTTTLDSVESRMQSCGKIPPSLAQAIIYYSTSRNTPQQTISEISVTARVLEKKSPCNFLIFGLGHDSLMWASLNHGGKTVFLEEDKAWIDEMRQKLPSLVSHHVVYNTKLSQADELMESARVQECTEVRETRESRCPLALKELPGLVHEIEWDLIMVDAPTGYRIDAPGRMGAIYTAGMMARARREGETHVFVHDVDRAVEDKFSKAFLCEGYLTEQEGRLRHFTIPSHRVKEGMPFCP